MTHFIFEGFDTVELARKYGTPLYVMSQDRVERAVDTIKRAFESAGLEYDINYAGKAFLNSAMCRIAMKLGLCLDVVSGGELYTALQAGFDPAKITFHGSNKSQEEIREALDAGVGTITIDSIYEIGLVDSIAGSMGKTAQVHLRLSPGVEAHTHEYILTGRLDSKFGIPISMATRAVKNTIDSPNLRLKGLHCHIGSQIMSPRPFEIALLAMIEIIYNTKQMGCELTELNMGGGLGITYLQGDESFDVEGLIGSFASKLREQCSQFKLRIPKLIIEPGRYIVGPAGITLYTAGTVKEIPYIRKYVSVDGGMTDNPRPMLYNAMYNAVVANKYDSVPSELVTISGRCCETDTLIKDILLPEIEPGDIIAVLDTGAYNYSMSSQYNRIKKPCVVLLSGENDGVMVRRDTYEILTCNDATPSWLED